MKFDVLQDQAKNDCVWLSCNDGPEVVLGAITYEAFADDSTPPQHGLSHRERVMLASANLLEISQVLEAKFSAGEAVTPRPGDIPRVIIRAGDLPAAGVRLKASVLSAPPLSWVDPQTGL